MKLHIAQTAKVRRRAPLMYFYFMGLILFLTAAIGIFAWKDLIPSRQQFSLWNITLLAYLTYEIIWTSVLSHGKVWLNPPVLASIVSFLFAYSLPNYFNSDEISRYFSEQNLPWMNKAMICINVSAFAMWLGYRIPAGKWFAKTLWKMPLLTKALKNDFSLNYPVVIIFLLVSLVARSLQISLGVYGYSSDSAQLTALAPYRQYLDMGVGLGQLAFVAVCLVYFSRRHYNPMLQLMVTTILLYEILFGFFSGFKGAVVLPLVILGLCSYCIKGKVPKHFVAAAVVALFMAYFIIQPYRQVVNKEPYRVKSLKGIAEVMLEQVRKIEFSKDFAEELFFKHSDDIVSRLALTQFTALSLEYKDTVGLSDTDPEFSKRLYLAPFLAYIPRILWPSKPSGTLGGWFAVEVVGMPANTTTSIGMSPVGYLYFAGGIVAVFLGWLALGIAQRTIYEGLFFTSSGALTIFFGLISYLVVVSDEFSSCFVATLRFAPFLIIAQHVLYKKEKSNITRIEK